LGLLRNRGLTDDERRRLPPGQHLVRDFPVLHAGSVPYDEAPADWDFQVSGAVRRPFRLDLRELRALPTAQVTCDIHCVTSWSKLGTNWEGVPIQWVLDRCEPNDSVTHVIAHAEEGYSANLPLGVLADDDVLLAYRYDGLDLEPEHGYPLRLLVPKRYLWKSAKWLRGLEFVTGDRAGFWERYGYSMSADPWKEERYAF
jgi:DMSO/TMAO reductase YedYZ molybdopterin-dependent catalytic subunit